MRHIGASTPSPIILFAYNRPLHTEQALEALSKNEIAKKSILYIYADGPKENASIEEHEQIKRTRDIFTKKQWCKTVNIIASAKNKGLATSVIDGTTDIVEKYGKVITIEDDVIVSKYFLDFMNKALDMYEQQDRVWMISGYYWPVTLSRFRNKSFFLPVSTTQAWGTWLRAWQQFDINATGFEKLSNSASLRKKFNLDNSFDFTRMLMMQMKTKQIDSWAIRFWWSMVNNNALILFPDKSLIKNIGWDGSGVHCSDDNKYFDDRWDPNYKIEIYPQNLRVNSREFRKVKTFHKGLIHREVVSLKNIILGKVIQIKQKIIRN